jgi:hypothetical protein
VDGAFISINHQEKVILGTGQPSACYYSSSVVEIAQKSVTKAMSSNIYIQQYIPVKPTIGIEFVSNLKGPPSQILE